MLMTYWQKRTLTLKFFAWCNDYKRPERQQLTTRKIIALGNLKKAMREYGFDLVEGEGDDGRSKELKKRPRGSDNPVVVYGRIRLQDATDQVWNMGTLEHWNTDGTFAEHSLKAK